MKNANEDLKELVKNLIKTSISAKKTSDALDGLLVTLLVPGSHYLRMNPVNHKRAIFGQILSPNNTLDNAILEDDRYRLVKAYSIGCVEGEYGTETVDNMIPISPELFEYAKSKKWDITAKNAMQFVLLLARAELGQTPKGSA